MPSCQCSSAFPKRSPDIQHRCDELHFAYGANINQKTLSRRGVKPKKAQPAVLASGDISFRFQHRTGYATLVHSSGQEPEGQGSGRPHVHGVLYTLSPSDLQKLVSAEIGYYLTDVEARVYGERDPQVASSFVTYPTKLLANEVPPSARYLHQIQDGAEDAGLDPDYQAWLRTFQPAPFTGRGLGPEYYDCPQKYLDWAGGAILAIVFGALSVKFL